MYTIPQIRELRKRSERLKRGVFYAEGNKIVAQAMQYGATIVQGVVAPSLVTSDLAQQTLNQMVMRNIPLLELRPKQFNAISFKRNPSGVGAIIRANVTPLHTTVEGLGWVVLDGVGNAGNLGAICRTCDAVGVSGIVMLGNTVDAYHPDAVRASLGAIFGLRLMKATAEEFADWKRASDIPMIGTSDQATQSYRECDYAQPSLLMMGSERLGISAETATLCDQIVSIPMIGSCDSLNLAVATSVMLYEMFHQKKVSQ